MNKIGLVVILTILTCSIHTSAQIKDGGGAWGLVDEKIFIPSHPFSLFKADTISLSIIGDVMMHSPQFINAHKIWKDKAVGGEETDVHGQYDFSSVFSAIKPDLENADIAIANMEFTLGGTPFSGYPCFSAPDSYADYVMGLGVDVFLTANNHILDKAPSGAKRTLERYGRMNVMYTGSGLDKADFESRNPLIFRSKGIRIAIVNFTYGTNITYEAEYPKIFRQTDSLCIEEAMAKARGAEADLIIVMPHWGLEYRHVHDASQRALAQYLADAGADIIIGAHPHVVQDMEVLESGDRKVPVYYSLGNAVSNMSAPGTQLELMVKLDIIRRNDGSVILMKPKHEWLWCSRPGDICEGYSVVKVADQSREQWIDKNAFDKMSLTLETVMKASGLE